MSSSIKTILAIGATGSIGRPVVEVALEQGYKVRALVRNPAKANFPPQVELVKADVTAPETLAEAVAGIDAVIFTLGSDGQGKEGAESIDYGGVRNVLMALGRNRVRIALMTAIGVTNRAGSYNQSTEAHDWKRRAERLVRASGNDYTIVRPGWFDYNGSKEHKLVFLQGDKRQSGTPKDGAIARRQIAEVLVGSLNEEAASRKSLELVAVDGPAQRDLTPLFVALEADVDNPRYDAIADRDNQPIEQEPQRVREDLNAVLTFR